MISVNYYVVRSEKLYENGNSSIETKKFKTLNAALRYKTLKLKNQKIFNVWIDKEIHFIY